MHHQWSAQTQDKKIAEHKATESAEFRKQKQGS